VAAFSNLKKICDEHLSGRVENWSRGPGKHPQLAAADQNLALPTPMRKLPAPLRKERGRSSDTERAIVGLQLRPGKMPD
jgi:circadian clock protein KaiB